MQRLPLSSVIWLPILLAVCACTSTVPHPRGAAKPGIIAAEKIEKPAPAAAGGETQELPLPETAAIIPVEVETRSLAQIAADGEEHALLVRGDESAAPHIALLLPLESAAFGATAEVVRQGFMAAANAQAQGLPGELPVRVYSSVSDGNDIVTLYRQAIAAGARAVVGPLTRTGVSLLAAQQDIPVPTLALNIAEGQFANRLYFFGMMVEDEARQVAQLAARQGLHQAIVIATNTQLARRLQFAFEEEWQRLGGTILREIEFNGDSAVLAGVTYLPDLAVFLAAGAEEAHLIRPYLLNQLPIYATSRVFLGNNEALINYDLNGIRFVDMPWLLQADHPAVMVYPHPDIPLSIDHERFYALGIDAYRLIRLLLAGQVDANLSLDGVSGDLRLNGHTFQRMAMPAIFAQGQARTRNGRDIPVLPIFPDQTIENRE
ncbi:MAG TPA: penicillin-binding protein activator [Gallionella sp.]|nr:penicillin-binding protein activator [Gallionella sp.]